MRKIGQKAMTAVGSIAYFLVQTVDLSKANVLEKLLYPVQHTVIPFEAGRKGAVAATDYHASRDASFYFYLNLNVPEDKSVSWAEVRTIAGSGATRNGVPINNGVPIPVRLVIEHLGKLKGMTIFDQIIQEERLESHSQKEFSKIITAVHLTRGDYKVKVESLEDITALGGIPVDFDIHIPGNLK